MTTPPSTLAGLGAARPARPAIAAAPPAPLSDAEQARIAEQFPDRPAVAQTLYGADRTVQTVTALGQTLDLTA